MKPKIKPAAPDRSDAPEPNRRYARTPENIAVALGCNPSAKQLIFIREWMQWPGFPKKGKHGYEIKALEQWTNENAERIVIWKKRGKLLQIEEDITSADLKLFTKGEANPPSSARPEGPRAEAPLRDPVQDFKRHYQTQASLAAALQLYYRGRIRYEVSKTVVSKWCQGILDPNVPPPPPKNPDYFVLAEWVAWFDQHILPAWKYATDAQGQFPGVDIRRQAETAKDEITLFDRDVARIRADSIKGSLVQKDAARNTRRGALKLYQNIVIRCAQNDDPKKRVEFLQPLLTPEQLLRWREFDLDIAKAFIDRIVKECHDLSTKDPETELAAQLAESVKT